MVIDLIAQASGNAFDNITSLGAAGLMGAMWLWERRNSQKREQDDGDCGRDEIQI